MIVCAHSENRKRGKDRHGRQKYQCKLCGCIFTDPKPKPLGDMRLSMEKAIPCLTLLLEGMSIRAVERTLSVHRDTIVKLIVEVGERCKAFMESTIKDVEAADVQADETWGFVFCKARHQRKWGYGENVGDAYTYFGLDRDTKLVLAWHLGKRTEPDTFQFIEKLDKATSGRFQLSTDGLAYYREAVRTYLTGRVDFGQLVKIIGSATEADAKRRYSPGDVVGIKKYKRMGNPDVKQISTSHIERANLTIRMHVRRMTRLTSAHSKKWENHEAALGLYFAYYNFVRVHSTIKKTPAMAAGLTDHAWTLHELLLRMCTQS